MSKAEVNKPEFKEPKPKAEFGARYAQIILSLAMSDPEDPTNQTPLYLTYGELLDKKLSKQDGKLPPITDNKSMALATISSAKLRFTDSLTNKGAGEDANKRAEDIFKKIQLIDPDVKTHDDAIRLINRTIDDRSARRTLTSTTEGRSSGLSQDYRTMPSSPDPMPENNAQTPMNRIVFLSHVLGVDPKRLE